MDYIKRYIILVVMCISLTGCIKEPIYPIPEVKFTVDWSGISAVGGSKGSLDSAYVYLYPQFDYKAEPIVIKSLCHSLTCAIMPGTYKLIMHNTPMVKLRPNGTHSYDDFIFNLPVDADNYTLSSDQLHTLSTNNPMNTITVRAGEGNVFKLSPVTATKNIRFTVKTSNFGTIVSAGGVISGVLTSMKASTWEVFNDKVSSVQLGAFTVKDSTLSGGAIDVLGVNEETAGMPKEERVVLTLSVQNTASDKPLTFDIDLTKELQELEGDEIEVKLIVECGPEIKVTAEIKQWIAGGEVDVEITTHPDEIIKRKSR